MCEYVVFITEKSIAGRANSYDLWQKIVVIINTCKHSKSCVACAPFLNEISFCFDIHGPFSFSFTLYEHYYTFLGSLGPTENELELGEDVELMEGRKRSSTGICKI